MIDLVVKALMEGGPYAVSLAGWLAWWYERRLNREHSTQMLALATAQVEAMVKHEAAISTNTRLLERSLFGD